MSEHTPGGHQHDQKSHGQKGSGGQDFTPDIEPKEFDKFNPVEGTKNSDFTAMPEDSKVASLLHAQKKSKVRKNRDVPAGTAVGLRIDIPAFLANGEYVVTVHEQGSQRSIGKPIGYDRMARVKDASFWSKEDTALLIMHGMNKTTSATVRGKIVHDYTVPSDINSWTPVGYNPKRATFFYDKRTGREVTAGAEAVSIGNSVFVRNPKFGDRNTDKHAKTVRGLSPKQQAALTKRLIGLSSKKVLEAIIREFRREDPYGFREEVLVLEHKGPGPHKSGSPQSIHGKGGGAKAKSTAGRKGKRGDTLSKVAKAREEDMGYYSDLLVETFGINVHFNDDGTMRIESSTMAEVERESQAAVASHLLQRVHNAQIVALLNEHPHWKHEFKAFNMSAGDDPRAAQELIKRVAAEWGQTSTDSNITSLALQKAVAKRFGLADSIAASSASSEKTASQLFSDHEEAFLGIADAIYKDTQDTLEAYGIKKLVLYRGMRVSKDDAGPGMKDLHAALSKVIDDGPITDVGVPGKLAIKSNPLSSYSASPGVGFAFAGLTTSNNNTAVLGRVVDAKDVFSLPVGSFSYTLENEVVVIGRPAKDIDVLIPTQPFTADEYWQAVGGTSGDKR